MYVGHIKQYYQNFINYLGFILLYQLHHLRTFSALKRLLTYLRSTMTEKRLNNCLLLHVHKELTDQLNITDIANEFISANSDRNRYFGSFSN